MDLNFGITSTERQCM